LIDKVEREVAFLLSCVKSTKLNSRRNRMINCIADFASEGGECGVGLALQDENGRFLFFIPGLRYMVTQPPG
jgi:hypothetical protein